MMYVKRRDDGQMEEATDRPRDPKPGHLAFLRWLAERDLIEHRPLGRPSGHYAAPRTEAPRH